MTRRATILAYLLLLSFLLLGLQNWGIALDRVQRHVIARVEARTGLRVASLDKAEFALLPLPRISLSNVAFSSQDGSLSGRAVRVRARLRLLPLIAGQVGFDRIDLVAPAIDVAVAERDEGPPDWAASALGHLDQLDDQARIVLTGGSLFVRSGGAIRTTVRDINLVIDERTGRAPFSATGTLAWRGMPAEVEIGWPMAQADGRVVLSFSSPLVTVRLDGERSGGDQLVVNGLLSFRTRSASELAAWLGDRTPLLDALGRVGFTATAQIRPQDLALSGLTATIEGETLEGAVKLGGTRERRSLSGTLAGSSLDLGRLLDRMALPVAGKARDGATPLDFERWTAHDVDLRVSVEQARLHGARLSEVATQLLVRRGRFEIGLLRGTAYGGSVRGRLLAVAAPAGVDVRAQGFFDRISLAQAGGDLAWLSAWSGVCGGQIVLEGLGATAEAVLASAAGKVSLTAAKGEVAGAALAEVMRRAERGPASALKDWRQGRTPFEAASLTAAISRGEAEGLEAMLSGAAYRLSLAGRGSLPEGTMSLQGWLASPSGGVRLPFELAGPLLRAQPRLDLEAQNRTGEPAR